MLIVEDGSVVIDANSFISVEFADAYFSQRNVFDWLSLDKPAKEGLLVLATDALSLIYAEWWQGSVVKEDQVLQWPRIIEGSPVFPLGIQNATAELALFLKSNSVFVTAKPEKNGLMAASAEKAIGPLKLVSSYKKDGFGSEPALIIPPKVFMQVKPFLIRSGVSRVIR